MTVRAPARASCAASCEKGLPAPVLKTAKRAYKIGDKLDRRKAQKGRMNQDSTASAALVPCAGESPRMFIKSFGCQMNVYDATRMSDALASHGYSAADSAETADLVILNTCHIREKAAEKVFSELGRLAKLKATRAAAGRPLQIAVAGCVAQAEGAEIVRRQGAVDLVVGPQAYHRLPALVGEAMGAPGLVDTSFPPEDKFEHLPPPSQSAERARGASAFLTVQEGCDKFCNFCVVPYTRGAEFSRPPKSVLAEAERIAAAGAREITLLGQNVNAYRGKDGETVWSLAQLIGEIAQIPGVARIRYTTSHPNDMGDDLIDAHAREAALMPFLHLPVQSGSDAILAAMNRRHRAADYLRVIEKVRRARPDIALSSDFIVGFPGESEADFERTLELVAAVRFASAYSFKYSPRPGTPGAQMRQQIDETVKSRRLARLQAMLEDQKNVFNADMVGRVCAVLFEKLGRRPGQTAGKSPFMQAVQADGPATLVGSVALVKITAVGSNSLFGRMVDGSEPDAR